MIKCKWYIFSCYLVIFLYGALRGAQRIMTGGRNMQILCILCMGMLPMLLNFLVIMLLIHKNKEIKKVVLDIGKCHLELLMFQPREPV